MIYIHIPFCESKCLYCDFNSYDGIDYLKASYADALQDDIVKSENIFNIVETIYIGGGTPLLIGAEKIQLVLKTVKKTFDVAKEAEISIEANPESINPGDLLKLRESGVNRISLGFQSLSDRNLSLLGRIHDANKAVQSYLLAREAGYENINIDMIYGIPGQSLKDWEEELEQVIDIGPEHLSLYPLSIEEGTPLKKMVDDGRINDIDEDNQAEMMEATASKLLKYRPRGGYRHYEISNYAIDGYDCSHNLNYWSCSDYLGFGAGAHSHRQGRRWWNVDDPVDYVEWLGLGSKPVAGEERLTIESRVAESIFLGLRMMRGADIDRIEERFEVNILKMYESEIKSLIDDGLIEIGNNLKLTKKGEIFANQAMSAFV